MQRDNNFKNSKRSFVTFLEAEIWNSSKNKNDISNVKGQATTSCPKNPQYNKTHILFKRVGKKISTMETLGDENDLLKVLEGNLHAQHQILEPSLNDLTRRKNRK